MNRRVTGIAAVMAAVLFLGVPRLTAQAPATLIEQGKVAYQNLDYENAADLMRRGLKSSATLDLEQQQQAYSYIGAAEFFLGHRDAAVSAFRDLSRLDARVRLDPLVFPPEVQRVYEDARRTVRIVQAEVPAETELRLGKQELPIRLYANIPQTIVVTLGRDPGEDRVTLFTGSIADSMDLTWDGRGNGGAPARTGAYSLRVASLSGGRVLRTVRVPLQVTLQRQDTVPLPRAPESSRYLSERSLAGPLKSVVRGFAMGILAIGVPAAMGADTRSMVAPLVVGGAISASGLIDLMTHPNGTRVESNVIHNRRIRDTWQQRVDSLTAENRRRREDVRLLVHASAPMVQEGGSQ